MGKWSGSRIRSYGVLEGKGWGYWRREIIWSKGISCGGCNYKESRGCRLRAIGVGVYYFLFLYFIYVGFHIDFSMAKPRLCPTPGSILLSHPFAQAFHP
jgi:hypothetical protein